MELEKAVFGVLQVRIGGISNTLKQEEENLSDLGYDYIS